MQLICMPPLFLSIVAVVLPKRLDVSMFSKLYLSKLKTVVEQVWHVSRAAGLDVICGGGFLYGDFTAAAVDNTVQVQDFEDDARVRQGRPYCSWFSAKHSSGFTAKSLSTVMIAVAASVPDDNGQNQVPPPHLPRTTGSNWH